MATVFEGKSWRVSDGDKLETTYFRSTAILKERPGDYESPAKEIASIVLHAYPDVMKKDVLAITVTYGYDIGIARAWRSQSVHHSPEEWQKILRSSQSKL